MGRSGSFRERSESKESVLALFPALFFEVFPLGNPADSSFTDSTNHRSKIFGKKKKSRKFQTAKLEFCHVPETIYIIFTFFRYYK